VSWIYVALDEVQWRVLVKTVMGLLKGEGFVDQLSDTQFPKRDCVSWIEVVECQV
jgi:hypothetical protein